MSYCRWGDDSDLYIFGDGDGWACCNCSIAVDAYFGTLAELKAHVQLHIDAGHKVPDYVMDRINCELATGHTIFGREMDEGDLAPPEWN